MVSLSGALQAEPIVTVIETLTAAQTALSSAIAGGGSIWKMDLQVYTSSQANQSTTIEIVFTFNSADTSAILNDIKNIISNQINIQTNLLGTIT